jgi:hypothetical protein
MNLELEQRANMIIGIFTVACMASSYYYGMQAVIAWLIGMLVCRAMLNAVS